MPRKVEPPGAEWVCMHCSAAAPSKDDFPRCCQRYLKRCYEIKKDEDGRVIDCAEVPGGQRVER